MTIVLDHFFILTDPGAPQAALLSGLGLLEGAPNNHPGQGTANRRFFFSNSMLELIYIRDYDEAISGPGSRLRLVERDAGASASPFGLIFRAGSGRTGEPFPGWRYYPEYLDDGGFFYIGENSELLAEPLCVYMPFHFPAPGPQAQSAGLFASITELRISVPVDRPSPVLETIAGNELISLRLNEPHRMELVFNENKEGKFMDFRPELPLLIQW
jgi:hypothetical protein